MYLYSFMYIHIYVSQLSFSLLQKNLFISYSHCYFSVFILYMYSVLLLKIALFQKTQIDILIASFMWSLLLSIPQRSLNIITFIRDLVSLEADCKMLVMMKKEIISVYIRVSTLFHTDHYFQLLPFIYLLMIKSEAFIFVQKQPSPESKNSSSNTDDQFVVIQTYIFSSCSAYTRSLGTYIHSFPRQKNKPCTKNK